MTGGDTKLIPSDVQLTPVEPETRSLEGSLPGSSLTALPTRPPVQAPTQPPKSLLTSAPGRSHVDTNTRVNIILTGIPRSGTTLTCHLLNQAPNTIALHEPYNPYHYLPAGVSDAALVDEIDRFFAQTRQELLNTGLARSKQLNGQIPDNPKSGFPRHMQLLPNSLRGRRLLGRRSLRKRRVEHGFVHFEKPLSPDFTLCVKHNAAYASLLGELTKRYPCHAIIRNPLAILASWNGIDFDLRDGDMTITDLLDKQLAQRLAKEPDRLNRQREIVEWFFTQYDRHLSEDRVIRYEDLVDRPGPVLRRIGAAVPAEIQALRNKNRNAIYNRRLMKKLAGTLVERPSIIWRYYPPDAIEGLLEDA